ncbi:MAG: hypothetical protein M3548_16940 [Actinomycetota bacterium]|nr:hypothetical protein [Actinomycetota bacterium]
MTVRADQALSLEADNGRHDGDPGENANSPALVSLCDEADFAEAVEGVVADEAPRLFAIVQVYGARLDGRIAAWGMAFDDHAEVIGVEGRTHMSLRSPALAVRGFGQLPDVTARLVWVNPDAAGAPDELHALGLC